MGKEFFARGSERGGNATLAASRAGKKALIEPGKGSLTPIERKVPDQEEY